MNQGRWALLLGSYPCAWVSTYHQDSCLWRCDLLESQQVHGITADNALNNFPDAPTSSSSALVLEVSCFDCLGSFIIPWHVSRKTSACNLIASLRCSTSTAAIWNGRWRWFGGAEGRRAGGLDPNQVVMAGPLPAQPSSSPTSQGQHSPCHTCLDFLPAVVNYCHYKQRKKNLTAMN